MLSDKVKDQGQDSGDDRSTSLTKDEIIGSNQQTREEAIVPDNSGGKEADDEIIQNGLAHGPQAEGVDNNDLKRIHSAVDLEAMRTVSSRAPVHSVFSKSQKRYIVFMTAFAGFFSPVSANIYYPALNPLARDLHVTDSLINLTITSYMIFQRLAPAIFGDLADSAGRRPAYLIGFTFYLAANIGLALQNNYAALFVLRCVQSTGSSATIAIAYGIVADISTSAERGTFAGAVTAGMMLGPSLGPVIGGLLAEFLGWRAIFWFLAISCGTFMVPFVITFPETSRKVVGNGSIPPQGWNMSLLNWLQVRMQSTDPKILARTSTQERQRQAQALQAAKTKARFPNPLHVIHIILEKEIGILLTYNSILYIGFVDLAAALPSLFVDIYNFNDLRVGLCYIPFGIGRTSAAFINGRILDRNYRRLAKKHGLSTSRRRQVDLRYFNIEQARLQVMFPMLYAGIVSMIAYGWVLDNQVHIAGPLVLLFCQGYFVTGSFNILSTLLVDLNPQSPATATAANNLVRCLVGAGAIAVIVPMVNGMGRGWTFTFIALFMGVTSVMPWMLYFVGMKWRKERRTRIEREEAEKESRVLPCSRDQGKEILNEKHIEGTVDKEKR